LEIIALSLLKSFKNNFLRIFISTKAEFRKNKHQNLIFLFLQDWKDRINKNNLLHFYT
jgi:hypothetical protein